MPVEAKSLFRPDVLRPHMAGFVLPPHVEEFRPRLRDWSEMIATGRADQFKEQEILHDFLTDVFGGVLGYSRAVDRPDRYTFSREKHVQVDGKFADAVLGDFRPGREQFVVAVEGKGPKDPLDRPFAGRKMSAVDQAYRYAINLPCDWIVVTSIRQTRLYHKGSDQQTYERFDTEQLASDEALLRKFVFLLGAERVVPESGRCHFHELLAASEKVGRELTKEFYVQYADMRELAFERLSQANPGVPKPDVLAATQKLLDRILFCAFCEDRGLLPAETIQRAYEHVDPYNPRPVWENFRGLFRAVNLGNPSLNIPAYNGGLFAVDPLLDSLSVPDDVCRTFHDLAVYDYRSPHEAGRHEDIKAGEKLIDVDILGHIFEQSISDLERIRNELDGLTETLNFEKHTARRKKEGAFYTPAFITRYILEQALGQVLAERFEALRRGHAENTKGMLKQALADPSAYDLSKLNPAQRKGLVRFWEDWQEALKGIRLLDPACGSGAFLIEAFEQLHAAYQAANDRLEELRGNRSLFDLDRQILQHNLYGVDLNDEAVEICRLSLWIKTAQRGKALTSLDHTIRVGNSVVADSSVHPKAFDWQTAFPEVFEQGGFDVVVGNPPYVRQEWIAPYKPYFQQAYKTFHGVADLYVYFYELGMRVLKPGGRLSFIVTNKWMKAGYGEPLRRFFGEETWVESVVDFGHAKQIFEDADVFPSIIVARKPSGEPAPSTVRTCVIPRDQLRVNDLSVQIAEQGSEVGREDLNGDAWMLEPRAVNELITKIQGRGIALTEYTGIKPYRGIVTGYNEAFVIDSNTRDALVARDAKSNEIIKPFLRGQDIKRWAPEWAGLWMIFTRRGIDIDQYPAIKEHLEAYRNRLEPKPKDWSVGTWPGRKPGPYKWFEIQDSVEYWNEFERPKIVYQEIQFHPSYTLDTMGRLGNNKIFFIAVDDLYLLSVLNSPLMWWHNWRFLPHMKDEALSPVGFKMESLPIARPNDEIRSQVEEKARRVIQIAGHQLNTSRDLLEWLKVEHEVEEPNQKLRNSIHLNEDAFIAEIRKIRGKKKPLSLAALRSLREEYANTLLPAQELAREARRLEGDLSDLVNEAYGLTPDEVRLMWETAPPRMPIENPMGSAGEIES